MAYHSYNAHTFITSSNNHSYSQLGMNDTEIEDFLSGAAFLAWFRMGNIQKWGGPLSADWRQVKLHGWMECGLTRPPLSPPLLSRRQQQRDMQLQILQRSREFGMISVLPGFAGHVPAAIKRIFPNVTLLRSASWNGFNATYSEDYMIEVRHDVDRC